MVAKADHYLSGKNKGIFEGSKLPVILKTVEKQWLFFRIFFDFDSFTFFTNDNYEPSENRFFNLIYL